jgi:cytochrome c peroxidase
VHDHRRESFEGLVEQHDLRVAHARARWRASAARRHSGPELTDANDRLHPPGDVVREPEPGGAPSYASRSATKQYRTAPLHGIWQHAPYFHNGGAPTLESVVRLYGTSRALGLTQARIADLTEYLKSL